MRQLVTLAIAACVLSFAAHQLRVLGQEAAADGTAKPAVLDASSLWRFHHELGAPRIRTADGVKPLLIGARWFDVPTAKAPLGWTDADFDDTQWLHGPLSMGCDTPYAARLQARGAFGIDDPAKVRGLRLSVAYYGGVVVSLNGHEVAKQHVAGHNAMLAEAYPKSVFVNADGKLLDYQTWRSMSRPEKDRFAALRRRKIENVALPAEFLQKGRNVVSIEVVAAPYDAVVDEQKLTKESDINARGTAYDLSWSTCRLLDATLTSDGPAGLAAEVEGSMLRVWNSSPMIGDPTGAVPAPGLAVQPVRLLAPRNGKASGVVVAHGKGLDLKGLKATAGDLVGSGGSIKSASIEVRYAGPWDQRGSGRTYIPVGPDMLLGAPPEKVGAGPLPVWITVNVPADVAAGIFKGKIALRAGNETVEVPVEMTVADWTCPSPGKQRTWLELMQCPDAVAMEYGLELWSDKHWEYMDRSFALMAAMGTRTIYLPLICRTNIGNAESMVRWIDRGEGKPHEYDFSILERYLDMALRHIKEPEIVTLYVWDVYLRSPEKKPKKLTEEEKKNTRTVEYHERYMMRWDLREKGPAVTAQRPDGTREMIRLPRWEDPRSKALWKPVFDGVRQRLKKRGIEDKAMLGLFSDWWATEPEVVALHAIVGEMPWVKHSHAGRLGYRKVPVYNVSHVAYEANVWNLQFNSEPVREPTYGWRSDVLVAEFDRFGFWNHWPAGSMRHIPEFNITGHQRGVGRIGADYWPTVRDKKGQRVGRPADRYPEVYWHNTNVYSMLLSPGPSGPVPSVRYERLREGIQECEARIAIEKALSDEILRAKLGEALVSRCLAVLDERSIAMWKAASEMNLSSRTASRLSTSANKKATTFSRHVGGVTGHRWFTSSDWQCRAGALYALAGEVTAAIAK